MAHLFNGVRLGDYGYDDTQSVGEHRLRVTVAGDQGRQVREATILVVD